MVEIKNVFNKAIEHVVDICTTTLDNVENSQNNLLVALEELERRLNSIGQLNQRLNYKEMSEACQSIEVYKFKIERVKNRLALLKKKISNIEAQVYNKAK